MWHPNDEEFGQINAVKSRVSEIESQDLRPIYDQRDIIKLS